MGYGSLIQEAVSDAENDMATVNAAAQAIVTAINGAKTWITDQTWTGTAATSWCGDWNGFYAQLLNLLSNQLPGAETTVVNNVRTQMEKLAQNQPKTTATAS
jgi:hypothetical protein